jgi:hypothetical protein
MFAASAASRSGSGRSGFLRCTEHACRLVAARQEGFEYAFAEGLLTNDRYFHVISRC